MRTSITSAFYSLAHMALGEPTIAFESLGRSYERHDQALLVLIAVPRGFDPVLDSFREDPRFHEFVKKMGLDVNARRD
jgi:hypothetical protein